MRAGAGGQGAESRGEQAVWQPRVRRLRQRVPAPGIAASHCGPCDTSGPCCLHGLQVRMYVLKPMEAS